MAQRCNWSQRTFTPERGIPVASLLDGRIMTAALRTIESGPPIEERDVSSFERKHGIQLPSEYRAFLLRSNGGRPERDLFPVPGFAGNPVGRLHFFFGIGDPVESCDLEWNLKVFSDRIPAHLLPVA